MTAIEINTKEELLAYLNETTREGVIEVADVECDVSCRVADLTWDYEAVKAITVELVTLNGVPADWLLPGTIRMIEDKAAMCEEILVDVRSTVQYVIDMRLEYAGDWTGGDKMDETIQRRTV